MSDRARPTARPFGLLLALLTAVACGADPIEVPAPPDAGALTALVADSHREAIERADRALAQDPGSAERWVALGEAYEIAALGEPAEACYRVAAELRPEDPRPLYRAAINALGRGESTRALRDLERVTELDADYGPAWRRLGFARLENGDFDAARTAFDRAAALLPNVPDAWLGRARVSLLEDDVDGALEAARTAHELAPDEAYPRLVLGEALRRAGRASEAAPHLEAGNASSPAFTDPWSESIARAKKRDETLVLEGVELEREGRFAEALLRYDDVLTRRPDDANVLRRKGIALLGADRSEDALAHLEAAQKRLPGHFEIAVALVGAYRETGAVARALGAATDMAAKWPDRAMPQILLGQIQTDMGDVGAAHQAFERARTLDPTDFRAAMLEGRFHYERGRFTEAAAILSRGLDGPGVRPPLVYFSLLMSAQMRSGAPRSVVDDTYQRAVEIHGDAADSLVRQK